MNGRAAATAVALFLAALLARLAVAALIRFPFPEDAAYYVAAARNLAEGHGLVVDAIWSYATPPLAFPRPAFELWQPVATLLSAGAMLVMGPSLAAAQLTGAVAGALCAPLIWAISRDATEELALPAGRARAVDLGSGSLGALLGIFLMQGVTPDSAAPFTALALLAAWLMPRALRPGPGGDAWRIALGLALGLAYLTRQEAVYLGLAYLVSAWTQRRGPVSLTRALVVPATIAVVVVAPWLVRQALTFERPTFGQALENAWLLRTQEVFAWAERPALARYLAAGPAHLLALRVDGFAHNLLDVLIVPSFPAGLLGLLSLGAQPRLARLAALRPLLVSSALIFFVTTLVFPVSSLWGTFLHAAGPVLAVLAIATLLGLDALVARLRRARRWRRENAWLAPFAAVTLAVPVALLEVALLRGQADATAQRQAAIASVAPSWGVAPGQATVIGNHPVWLSEGLGVHALALPDEPPTAILDLAGAFGATVVIVEGSAGERYPAGFAPAAGELAAACFRELPDAPAGVRAFRIVCDAAPP